MDRRKSHTKLLDRQLRMETLEARRVLAAVTVSTFSDIEDGDTFNVASLLADKGADGEISLREAILATNETGGADTIDFSASLNGATILLANGELTITDSVIIDATMLIGGITIDAGNGTDNMSGTGDGSRVFRVSAGNGDAVTLAGLTITGGDVSGDGGGISYDGAGDLTIRNSVIRDNYATGEGGGFFARANTTAILTIVDSVISGNKGDAKSTPFALAV